MGNHLSTLLYSPQRNLLSWEGFPVHSNLARTKLGFFVSKHTLVPGLSTGSGTACLSQVTVERPAGGPLSSQSDENPCRLFTSFPMDMHKYPHTCARPRVCRS